MKILYALLLIFILQSQAWAALSLDGQVNSNTISGSTVVVSGVSTSNIADIIIIASMNTAATNGLITGIADTAGLTWNHHGSACFVSGIISDEIWYAVAASTLSSDTITVTYAGTPVARVQELGVSGANTGSPFDAGSSFPICTTATTGTSNTVTYTTTTANDFLFSFLKVNVAFGTLTKPASSTALTGSPFTSASWNYQILSSTQSSATNVFSWLTAGNDSAQLVTAIQQAGAGVATPGILNGGPF